MGFLPLYGSGGVPKGSPCRLERTMVYTMGSFALNCFHRKGGSFPFGLFPRLPGSALEKRLHPSGKTGIPHCAPWKKHGTGPWGGCKRAGAPDGSWRNPLDKLPFEERCFGLGSNFFREILAIAFSVLSIRRKQESFQQEAEARRQGSFCRQFFNSASGRCPVSQNGRRTPFC